MPTYNLMEYIDNYSKVSEIYASIAKMNQVAK